MSRASCAISAAPSLRADEPSRTTHDAVTALRRPRHRRVRASLDRRSRLAPSRRRQASKLPTSLRLLRFDAAALSAMKIELYTDAYRALTEPETMLAEPHSRL